MRTENIYVTIRCTVVVSDETSIDDVAQRIAGCDYSVDHEDDICVITDTELLSADNVTSVI